MTRESAALGPKAPNEPGPPGDGGRLARDGYQVQLFGGPCVLHGSQRLEVPEGSRRLVVLVALSGGRIDRRKAAGQLWPDGDDARAAGNLRSALWRLKGAGLDVLVSDGSVLALRDGTAVDVDVLCAWARRVIDGSLATADLRLVPWPQDALDLLPGWYDDWVVFERERVRQRLLHALETLGRRLSSARRHAEAVEVAMTAVAADPLRDSAHRVLIEAHLAEGNYTEAWRAYQICRDRFRRELGVEPSDALRELILTAQRRLSGQLDRERHRQAVSAAGRPMVGIVH